MIGRRFLCHAAGGVLPLSPREERAGRELERGEIDKKRLLSPALSSFCEEERENMRLRAQSKSSAEQNWSVTRRGYARWSVALIVLRLTEPRSAKSSRPATIWRDTDIERPVDGPLVKLPFLG